MVIIKKLQNKMYLQLFCSVNVTPTLEQGKCSIIKYF